MPDDQTRSPEAAARIGDNHPPTFAEELTAETADFAKRKDALLESLKSSRIDSAETAAAVTALGGMLKDLRERVEAARKVRAEPFDTGKTAVQRAFKQGLIDPLDTAMDNARDMIDKWRIELEAKEAAARRQRELEAAEAQKAAAEAERKRQEAEKAGDIGATIKAEMEQVQAQDRVEALTAEQQTIRPDAMIRTQSGSAATATRREAAITNIGECLAWMIGNQSGALIEAITPLISRLTRAKVTIPGVEVREVATTQFRR